MRDPDYEDLLPLLSVPAEVHQPGLGGLTRRRFLQGVLATAGAVTVSSTGWAREAFASPIAPTDGVLVMVMLGGGNDGLNTFAPISGGDRSTYESLRRGLAIPAANLRPAADGYGFHPRLEKLAARYATGQVAVVRGVGQTGDDLSHFTSMATFMAGTASTSRSTGWLGRFLDGVSEFDSGMRGVTFSSSVPLHLVGSRAKVTAVPTGGGMWGADTTNAWERSAHDAVRAFASGPTGVSAWADRVAANGKAALDLATTIDVLYEPEVTTNGLVRDLTHAARLVNADLGTRVIGVSIGGWDTHSGQAWQHDELLSELDLAIEAFFATLAPAFHDQVTLATFSEFGRRPEANGSSGTDHGTASVALVVGRNVKGGVHGQMPSLTALDARENLVPTVDFRSLYASLLDGWLGADPAQVLGASFETLDLFTAAPGTTAGPPPPPPPNPAAPFPDWTAFVRQQYVDLLVMTPPTDRVAAWVSELQAGRTTPVDVITTFLTSGPAAAHVHPVLRAYRACFDRVPTRSEHTRQVGVVRASGLATLCARLLASSEFRSRNGTMTNAGFVRWLYTRAFGTTGSASRVAHWTRQLDTRQHTRASLLAYFLTHASGVSHLRNPVLVGHLYAGLLARQPSSSAYARRLGQLQSGTPLRTLVAEFFGTREYAERFP